MNHIYYASEIIKYYEGCALKAYRCSAGVLTIGYGDTQYPGLNASTTITQAVADQRLIELVQRFERRVVNTPGWAQMTSTQKAAIISFSFNTGWTYGADGFNTLNTALASGDVARITRAFQLYCRAGGQALLGLQRRRMAESQMFWGKKPKDAVEFALKLYP